MAFATEDDVAAALGRDLTTAESDSTPTLLDTATDLVVGYLGNTPDPVPDTVMRVVADMVAAVLTKPAVTTADYGAGGYASLREATGVHVGVESATTTGPWLTKTLKTRLAPYRTGGMVSMQLHSERE